MYTHRGAWTNAIGEITEHQLTQHSVYLWTLPLFHCNGWCFAWAVTAAGGRHICLRQPEASEAVRLIESEGVTHLCGAPVVVSALAQYCAANAVKFRNPAAHRDRGSAPAARRHTRRRGDRRGAHTRLRPHRNLRPAHHLRLEPGLGQTGRAGARASQSAPGRGLHGGRHGPAGGRPLHERRPGRRPDHGRSSDARQQRHAGILRESQGHRGCLSGRLVPLRRSRRGPPRRLHRIARPHEGHRDFGRREHLFHRSGEGAVRPPRGRRSRHRRHSRPEMGRGAEGVRRPQARITAPPPKS